MGKGHATLVSTYLVTQIESQCLIIRGRRVFSTQLLSVLKTPERLKFEDGGSMFKALVLLMCNLCRIAQRMGERLYILILYTNLEITYNDINTYSESP